MNPVGRLPRAKFGQRTAWVVENPALHGEVASYSPPPMTVLATDWLSISINLLLFVFVVVCLLMSMIILMQRPKNEGLGAAFGSGTTDQLFGARTTNVLQKATVYLATLFFLLTLTLAVLIGKQNSTKASLVAEVPAVPEAPAAAVTPESIAPDASKEEKPLEPEAVTPAAEAAPAEAAPAEAAPAKSAPAKSAPAGETAPPQPAESPAPEKP